MAEKREAVASPWGMVLQTPRQPNRTISPGTKIIEIFDQHRTLLILGEPGAGKTTMLLELAWQTIARAETDPTQPMPVVFNLSSWAERRPPLAEWLVEELNTKYSIPKKVAQVWVDQEALLLLLDGLDEVAQAHRAACVEAINSFRKNSLMSVVVCSRVADYEGLSAKLNLAQAIVLQPLTPQQIEDYLARFGSELSTLKIALQQDPTLFELAQSPLLLGITTIAYKGISTEELPQLNSLQVQRQRLFEVYVQRMFERRSTDSRYSPERIKHWVTWLAQRMFQSSQTVFLIEKMQPSWLQTDSQQRLYSLISRVIWFIPSLLIIGGFTTPFGLFLGMPIAGILQMAQVNVRPELVMQTATILWGLFWAIFGGIIFWRVFDEQSAIEPVEHLEWSWKSAENAIIAINGRRFNLTEILLYSLVHGPINIVRNNEVKATTVPNQGIKFSIKNAAMVGGCFILPCSIPLILVLVLGLLTNFSGLNDSTRSMTIFLIVVVLCFITAVGLVIGLWFGGFAFIQHFILRFVLRRSGCVPRNYTRFLDYCADRIILRKVGGGYIFIHRYLMEYFASLEPEQVEKIVVNQEKIGYGNH